MKEISKELDDVYLAYVKELSELGDKEMQVAELKRSIEDKRESLTSAESDGSHGVDISAHAFRQISERLEILAMENDSIYRDFINLDDPTKSMSIPSNLKSFIFTLVASAKKKGAFSKEASKNTTGGFEFRYNTEIKKWSTQKETLQFVCIVENNNIKTGYFNWAQNYGCKSNIP